MDFPVFKPNRHMFSIAEEMAERVPRGGCGAERTCSDTSSWLTRAAARGSTRGMGKRSQGAAVSLGDGVVFRWA